MQPYHEHKDLFFNLKYFGPCESNNNYGFKTRQPCIFFYLDGTAKWKPKPFLITDEKKMNDLEKTVPKEVMENIRADFNNTVRYF